VVKEKFAQCLSGNLKDPLEDLVLFGRIILKKVHGRNKMDWYNLAEDVDKWRAILNTVMDILFHEMGAVC
jgi:hypothetical protein